ncbi:MAG: trypsin-like peptidase domain-containing protein [Cyanobacteria bacterium CRU_2_1]|nr:trypsin-like peptidase domain-containing protein [Cyanobacteria bacterium RU_5_0]NJR59864.1 trypsin-like peptidase domain-containing protein [Cyanobacteria bacterium CRU_2_1]
MRFYHDLPAVLAGVAIASAIVVTIPQAAQALTGTEINDIAREVTVLIYGDNGHGSGVIIARNENTYSVLTNYHVVVTNNDYSIITADRKAHTLNYEAMQPLTGDVDLAIVEFTSEEEYPVAQLSTASTQEGQQVFVSGWPSASLGQLTRQFTDGGVSAILEKPIHGYQIAYTNITRPGMSGGPVFDTAGRVVAIHGLGGIADSDRISNVLGLSQQDANDLAALIPSGFNYSIPITTYLQLAPQAGIYLNVQVDNSPAPELGEPYVASEEPDPRDVITDVNTVLDTLDRTTDTIQNVCGFLGC